MSGHYSCCRLREAAVQIGDLYEQVHLAEQEQDQLSTERRQAEDEAEQFLYGEAEAFKVRTEMTRKLAMGKQVALLPPLIIASLALCR
eukprot:s2910_g9.t1